MSKSTKWMKKGFAWLLCLIMMTGMLSSAAVAGAATQEKPGSTASNNVTKISITKNLDKTKVWDDSKENSTPTPILNAEFSIQNKTEKKVTYTVTTTWMEKLPGATEFSVVKFSSGHNPSTEYVEVKKNRISTKSLEMSFISEKAFSDLYHGQEFYCLVEVKDYAGNVLKIATETIKISYKGRITFDLNYDKPGLNRTYSYVEYTAGDIVSAPEKNPERDGFDFGGWFEEPECKNEAVFPQAQYGRKTVYAKWTEKAKPIDVTLVYGTGSSPHGLKKATEKITILANSTLKAYGDANGYDLLKPICTRAGRKHTFLGWYTKNVDGDEVALTDAIAASTTLYARWGFRVDFDVALDGVEKIPAQVFGENGGRLKKPEDPKHNDYVFKGWAVEGSDKLYTFTNTTITDSFTLVAQWEKKVVKQAIGLKESYNLNYNGKVQSIDIVDADGNPITIPSTAYTLEYNSASGENEPKNVGWYSVALSLTDEGRNNYDLINANAVDDKVWSRLGIHSKSITISWSDDSFVYDGNEHCPEATAIDVCDGDTCELQVAGKQTNAGENYTATVTIQNGNYCFPENYDGQTKNFSIAKRPVTIIWDDDTDLIYNGTERTPGYQVIGLLGSNTDGVVANVTGGVELGSGTATIVFEGAVSNYDLPSNTSIAFTVSKIKPTLELIDTRDSVTYLDSFDIAYELKNADPDSVISVNSSNNKVASVKLNKKTGKITITGTEIGSTTITVQVAAIGGYEEATASFDLKVDQIETGLTLTGTKNSVVYGEEFKIGYKKENASNGAITFKSSDENVASIDRYGNIKALKTGEVTITVTMAETTHHTGATASFTFEVTQRVVTIDWSNTRLVYNGEPQLPGYTVKNVVDGDDIKLVVTGAQTDAGENYMAEASIDNENYYLDSKSAKQSFKIKKAQSTISAKDITKTYGEEPFTVSADTITGGTNVTVDVQWNYGVAYLNRENKVVITGAGEAYIKLTNKGDKNHEESSVTIKLTVDKKKVPVVWDNSDNPEVFTWDGKNHCPTAHVEKSYLVGNDKCDVTVSGSTKNVGTFTAKVTGLSNKNYAVDKEYSKKFTIKDVITSTKLTTSRQTKTLYYLGVNETEIQLNLTGINIVETFKSDAKDRITPVTLDMIDSSYGSKLGKQNVKVNYNNMEFTFEIQIIKMIEPVWGSTNLTYNGKIQAPEFSVKGLKDSDEFDKVIKVTADKNALEVNKNNTKYMATAEINRNFYDKYIFTDSHHHSYKYYTIAPKPVTLTWSFDGAAFKPSIIDGYDCDFFAGSEVLAPIGTIDDDDAGLVLATSDADGNPVEKATAVGAYTIDASLTNSNYIFKEGTTDSVSFRIINKASSANISVLIPQCGQESAYSGFEIGFGVDYVRTGMKRIQLADLDMVVMNQNVAFVDASDEKTVFEEKAAPINWASLGQADANSTINVKGFLVPQIKGTFTDDESFFNAISSFEDDKVSVEGGTTYSVILILTADSMTGFDADAINLIVSDEKENQKALRYVVATEYGVVALVDIDAVHNYDDQNPTIVDPEEGKAGSRTVKCYLVQDNVNQYNHDFVTSIDALEVTKIEVVKGEGFTDNYFVGDAFDYTGLKIKVYLSNGEEAFNKSYERDVTEDMISGFDSTEAGEKTITVAYGDCKAEFKVTVSKKQSSIDLKDIGEKVTVTYGDNPINLVFDAFNGDVNISSSDKNIAKVENGKLVIVGAGEAEITLEIKDTNAVEGFKKSFKFVVDQKTVGLEWSKDNTFTEDGAKHSLTAKATGLVGTDSCDVIVEGGSDAVGTHTVTATGLSNKNYKLPEKASATFVINAKEEPKTEDPKKEEPKKEEPKAEEPKKEDPKAEDPKKEETKIKADVKISNQFKDTYVVGEKFDPTGLTLEIENADGTKTVIPVTNEMVSGFDSSKVGNGEAIITYEDFSKKIPVTIVEKGDYTFTITTEANGDMHFVVVRKPGNEIAYSLYLGTYIDGKLVPADGIKTWSGSVHGLLFADYLKTLPAGDHKIEVVFKDGKAVATLTIPATTPASDASPVTGDTSSLTMWIILLAAAAAVLVAIRVYAAKRSNAE